MLSKVHGRGGQWADTKARQGTGRQLHMLEDSQMKVHRSIYGWEAVAHHSATPTVLSDSIGRK